MQLHDVEDRQGVTKIGRGALELIHIQKQTNEKTNKGSITLLHHWRVMLTNALSGAFLDHAVEDKMEKKATF